MNRGSDPKMTYEQYKEAVRVHRIRTDTPSLSELAREWGLPNSTVAFGVRRGIKRYDIRMHNESLATKETTSAGETHE